MSVASKRRFVTKQVKSEFVLPEDGDMIAQILGTRGNNLHEVEDASGEKYLVSMPTKFRKSVWVKRGQFVFIRPIEEGDKVKAEITNVLDDENVLYIREQKLWPLRSVQIYAELAEFVSRFEQDAERLTREAKRDIGGDRKHEVIDADMLPPSDSDEDEDEEEEVDEQSENDSSKLESISTCFFLSSV
ncbi:unnamed protein product [Toxocara canis]|uniref:Probable RNA-binding protein EIF1AD n=1 Tax=Toxocara canis TaxID=6265 RepID=A0A183UB58_TOXCA|nr:unnamed protein product [Toxocara canis]